MKKPSHKEDNKKTNSSEGCNPIGLIAEESLDLETENPEIDDFLYDFVEPNDSAIASHVSVVVVEMFENAFLHCAPFS